MSIPLMEKGGMFTEPVFSPTPSLFDVDQNTPLANSFTLFFRFYLFLERGEGKERGRETSMCETNIDWLPLACALTGD